MSFKVDLPWLNYNDKMLLPEWARTSYEVGQLITEQLINWEALISEQQVKLDEVNKERSEDLKTLHTLAKKYYKVDAFGRMLTKAYQNKGNFDQLPNLNKLWDNFIKAKEKAEKEVEETERYNESIEKRAKDESDKLNAAINLLLESGKKLGEDFEISWAILAAEDLVFDREVKKLQEADTYYSFGGDDSCEGCFGWDGVSRRCYCGNRRVDWTKDWAFDFRDPVIYGEAY